MKKMLAAAAILSLSLSGAAWAQSSSDSPGGSDSGNQEQTDTGSDNTGVTEQPSDNSAGDEPQCPPGQRSVDPSATSADPKCVAE
ncbi:MAG: hypothetical protein ACK4ZU_18975 [Allorhizobium sp.]